MKFKNLLQLLGFKGRIRRYPYNVSELQLEGLGLVRSVKWGHPSESQEVISMALVNGYKEYIKEGDFCIDIGAHGGDTTIPMGIAAGTAGCVLGLEPNPYVYPVLEKAVRANQSLCNIKTIMAAAGREKGFMEFEYSDSGFCNGGRHEDMSVLTHGHAFKLTVFAVNLEEELRADFNEWLPRFSFLKVDTEGFDLYVLQSITNLLQEYRPVIKTEIFKKTSEDYRRQMLALLEGLGYEVFRISKEPLTKGDRWCSENLEIGAHYDILALPDRSGG